MFVNVGRKQLLLLQVLRVEGKSSGQFMPFHQRSGAEKCHWLVGFLGTLLHTHIHLFCCTGNILNSKTSLCKVLSRHTNNTVGSCHLFQYNDTTDFLIIQASLIERYSFFAQSNSIQIAFAI